MSRLNQTSNRGAFRAKLVQQYRSILFRRQYANEDLCRSALFFAPHPDDETLGCGGTIAKKIISGASVHVVVMTDGCHSHSHLMSGEQLRSIREQEAKAATSILGVDHRHLTFLNYVDGQLDKHQASATSDVVTLLERIRPEEVFVPFDGEEPTDHLATNQIVYAAIEQANISVQIYEYPIWYWMQWPFAKPPLPGRSHIPKASVTTALSNLKLLTTFRSAVFVEDVLQIKNAALQEYRTQMSRYIGDERWKTLKDIADGDFLDCFLQDWEIFRARGRVRR